MSASFRDYEGSAAYRGIDFRKHPELYRVGKGEQGALFIEPYSSELAPLLLHKTPALAQVSAAALFDSFETYRKAGDFVGMDVARKLLALGVTRARREAIRRTEPDPKNAEAARHFLKAYRRTTHERTYRTWLAEQRAREAKAG